eukprot:TRINITY_DN5456_c0_g2_i1.p1 TRINITY_DN5456_c0_g2~~TRINITY_DN5456_c0_g2_i1.p1  ORF type:complete len:441 (-),score=89.73 TRINITY_DN5456_c0_g2_i1:186-1508(-)
MTNNDDGLSGTAAGKDEAPEADAVTECSSPSSSRKVVKIMSGRASSQSSSEADVESKRADEVTSKWKAQEPGRYVLLAGVVLAACAGFVNATAALTCGGFVSHVTGTTAKLGMAIEGHYASAEDADRIHQMFLLVFSFLVGATVCGLLVARNEVHFGTSAYGVVLMLNSALLIIAIEITLIETPLDWPAYASANLISLYVQSAACGLQNGMCTAHFGAVVRTTHLTGLFTDSGLTIGRIISILCRRRCDKRRFGPLDWAEIYVDLKKMMVFTSLFCGYVLGVCIGAAMSDLMDVHALWIPATITGVGGLTFAILRARCSAAFASAEADKLQKDMEEAEQVFERARNQIQDWQSGESARASENLEQLDEEVSKALNLLHEMEACLNKKMARRHSFTEKGKSEDGPARIASSPALARAMSFGENQKQRAATEPASPIPVVAG